MKQMCCSLAQSFPTTWLTRGFAVLRSALQLLEMLGTTAQLHDQRCGSAWCSSGSRSLCQLVACSVNTRTRPRFVACLHSVTRGGFGTRRSSLPGTNSVPLAPLPLAHHASPTPLLMDAQDVCMQGLLNCGMVYSEAARHLVEVEHHYERVLLGKGPRHTLSPDALQRLCDHLHANLVPLPMSPSQTGGGGGGAAATGLAPPLLPQTQKPAQLQQRKQHAALRYSRHAQASPPVLEPAQQPRPYCSSVLDDATATRGSFGRALNLVKRMVLCDAILVNTSGSWSSTL